MGPQGFRHVRDLFLHNISDFQIETTRTKSFPDQNLKQSTKRKLAIDNMANSSVKAEGISTHLTSGRGPPRRMSPKELEKATAGWIEKENERVGSKKPPPLSGEDFFAAPVGLSKEYDQPLSDDLILKLTCSGCSGVRWWSSSWERKKRNCS